MTSHKIDSLAMTADALLVLDIQRFVFAGLSTVVIAAKLENHFLFVF
jgi:hypothetical protein